MGGVRSRGGGVEGAILKWGSPKGFDAFIDLESIHHIPVHYIGKMCGIGVLLGSKRVT